MPTDTYDQICLTEKIDQCKKNNNLNDVTATSACNKVDELSDKILEKIPDFSLTGILGIGADAKAKQKILNELGINIDTDSLSKQISACDLSATQGADQIITGGYSPECIKMWKDIGLSNDDIKELTSIKDVTQTNSQIANNVCTMAQEITALSKMDVSIDNSAIQAAINKADGIATNSESDQDVCNNITSDVSACKYLSQKQCCRNKISNNISQQIELGGEHQCPMSMSKTAQKNIQKASNSCNIYAKTNITDEITTDTKNKTNQKAKNTAELSLFGGLIMFIMFIIGIILLVFFSPVIMVYLAGKKAGLIVGGLLVIMIGALVIWIWDKTKSPPLTINNAPLYNCDDEDIIAPYDGTESGTNVQRYGNLTYGEVEKLSNLSDDILGFDFKYNIDDNEYDDNEYDDNANVISPNDNTKGWYMLYGTIDRSEISLEGGTDDNDFCNTKLDTTQLSTYSVITKIKESDIKSLLYFGIVLCVFGFLLFLIGCLIVIFSKSKTPSQKKSTSLKQEKPTIVKKPIV